MHIAKHHAVSCVLLPNKRTPALPPQVDIHSRLRNDNIVQFFRAYNYCNSYAIVMEYAENGCLYGYLKQHPVSDSELTGQTLRWAEDIASGLNYLHNKICVIHLDLKSPNGLCVPLTLCIVWCTMCAWWHGAWCVCVVDGVCVWLMVLGVCVWLMVCVCG